MHLTQRAGLFLSVFSLITPLSALTWDKSSLDFSMEAGEGSRVVEFPFKNERAEPVTLGELKASCGCTAPTVDARLIPAGGKGAIKVTYTPGDRVGTQTAQVTVSTDEPGVEPVSLQLRIAIQPAVSLTPRLVQWTKAGGPVGRAIEIKRLSKAAVRVLEVKPAGDTLNIALKPGADPDTWLLTLTPKAIEKPFTTKVEIPVMVGERAMTYSVFAAVR